METWQERLFELIRLGDGFVACKGGTGTLVELAVVWEMLNKGVMAGKPLVALGDFWAPILERVREVEMAMVRAGAKRWRAWCTWRRRPRMPPIFCAGVSEPTLSRNDE